MHFAEVLNINRFTCKESSLGRERNPQRTPNSFFAGFFINPQRVSSQDILKAGKQWERRFLI
jgi:hypothetical protein